MAPKQFGRFKKKPTKKRYWLERHDIRNKLKRVIRSNGWDRATEWAREHGAVDMLNGFRHLKGRSRRV